MKVSFKNIKSYLEKLINSFQIIDGYTRKVEYIIFIPKSKKKRIVKKYKNKLRINLKIYYKKNI